MKSVILPFQPPKLIVGLGNPGAAYQNTRHNLGAQFVRELAQVLNIALVPKASLGAELGQGSFHAHPIELMISLSYMNLSGKCVASRAKSKGLDSSMVLVCHDELELEPGFWQFKFGGSAKGHNGLRSIMQALNSQSFNRLRLGIGRPLHKADVSHFVLAKASLEERRLQTQAMESALHYLATTISPRL